LGRTKTTKFCSNNQSEISMANVIDYFLVQ